MKHQDLLGEVLWVTRLENEATLCLLNDAFQRAAAAHHHRFAHEHVLKELMRDRGICVGILVVRNQADVTCLDITWDLMKWLPPDDLHMILDSLGLGNHPIFVTLLAADTDQHKFHL
jgi:hypothetical protein